MRMVLKRSSYFMKHYSTWNFWILYPSHICAGALIWMVKPNSCIWKSWHLSGEYKNKSESFWNHHDWSDGN